MIHNQVGKTSSIMLPNHRKEVKKFCEVYEDVSARNVSL